MRHNPSGIPSVLGVLAAAVVFMFVLPAQAQEPDPMAPAAEETPPPITAPDPGPEPEMPPPAPRRKRVAPRSSQASPVVRAEEGNMGMFFRFGGLAGLTHGNTQHDVGPLLFNNVGMKFVLSETLMIPIWFGTGIRVDSPSEGDAATNWGIDLGGSLEYHFRIWRRISPFIGGSFGLTVEDPTQESNIMFGIGLGPNMGVEYYIGDRLSLTAMYMFLIQIVYQDGMQSVTSFGLSTLAGGALSINYYF